MARSLRATIKAFFETGDVPTEAQYVDTIDSSVYWDDDVETDLTSNSDDKVPTVKAVVDGIADVNLQAVTDAGASTTNPLVVTDASLSTTIEKNKIVHKDITNTTETELLFETPTAFGGSIRFRDTAGTNEVAAFLSDIPTPSANTALVEDITKASFIGLFAGFDIDPKTCYRITDASGGVVRVWGVDTGTSTAAAFQEGSWNGSTLTGGVWGTYNVQTDTFTAISSGDSPTIYNNGADGTGVNSTILPGAVSQTALITPAQVSAGISLNVECIVKKNLGNGTLTIRFYINDTADLSGSPILVGVSTALVATTRQSYFDRIIRIKTNTKMHKIAK
jgi:hypothetical protein